jgi:pimeloyl-ACP methyl ester carboxylesterase
MTELTLDAERRLEDYLSRVRAAVRGTGETWSDVERDIREHVADALAAISTPVDALAMDGVLHRLGDPALWVQEDDLPWWRRVVRRMAGGPEDWRLAYLTFTLTLLGAVLFPFGGFILLIGAFLLARAFVDLIPPADFARDPRRWLIAPAILFVFAGAAVLLLVGPLVALGAWGIGDDGFHRPSLRTGDQTPAEVVRISLGYMAVAAGAWWLVLSLAALAAARRIAWLFAPITSGFRRRHALILTGAALLLLVAGAVLLFLSEGGPIARRAGPAQRQGALELQPVIFATTDHVVPRRMIAELGTLRVPERRDRGSERSVVVRFIRFRSTSKTPGPPIVYLAGGPGSSGVWSASGDRFPLFMRLREVADVIALDQRGVADVADCPGTSNYPLDKPADLDRLSAVAGRYYRECADAWSGKIDVAAYNTRENAEDLESLRVALGAEKISLWGISYGTHLALAYIRAHGDHVHRAILAGVEGPDDTYKLPGNIDSVLTELEKHVRGVTPNLRQSIAASVEALRRAPATVTVMDRQVTVGPLDLQSAIFSSLGEREDIEKLPARLARIFAGDYTPLGQWAYRVRRGVSGSVMSVAMDCASGVTGERSN